MIRVGTIKYVGGKKVYPTYGKCIPIEVMTPSTAYGDIGPYVLKNEDGQIMENIWQFSKVYKRVPYVKETYSKYNNRVIWEHPFEVHMNKDGTLTKEYWAWREKGMSAPDAIRYPVGRSEKARASCQYALWNDQKLDYVEARKAIYLPVYVEMVKKTEKFKKLKKMLEAGKDLLIMEVDGPRQESLNYYKEKYGVKDDFIVGNTIEVNEKNMNIMMNDTKHAFGHGYCLAMALLDMV